LLKDFVYLNLNNSNIFALINYCLSIAYLLLKIY